MPGQEGSKGNPASKRMVNAKRKDRRAKSWARGQRRKLENQRQNAANEKANQKALEELGGERRNYERVTLQDGKVHVRTKMESPGSALARTRREQRDDQQE